MFLSETSVKLHAIVAGEVMWWLLMLCSGDAKMLAY